MYENEVKRNDIYCKEKVKLSKENNDSKKKLQEWVEKNLKNKKLKSNKQLNAELKTNCQKTSISSSSESKEIQNSIDIKVNDRDVWKCIKSGEVDNHLIGVYNRTIDSERRKIFVIRCNQSFCGHDDK